MAAEGSCTTTANNSNGTRMKDHIPVSEDDTRRRISVKRAFSRLARKRGDVPDARTADANPVNCAAATRRGRRSAPSLPTLNTYDGERLPRFALPALLAKKGLAFHAVCSTLAHAIP